MKMMRPIVSALLVTSIGFGILFVILMILVFTTYTSSWKEEIWWLSHGSSPSLIASLVFSLLLLFWWSIAIVVSCLHSEKRVLTAEKYAIGGSQLLVAAIGLILWIAWDSVELENYHRYGKTPRAENLLEHLIATNPRQFKLSEFDYVSEPWIVHGVWELSDSPAPFPSEARYLALWRNEQYQFLDSKYQQLEVGKVRIGAWENTRNNPHWEYGQSVFFAEDGAVYYMNMVQGPQHDEGLRLVLWAGMVLQSGRISPYYNPDSRIELLLKNQRRVFSSHPIPLNANYPFYDEATRGESFGNRINPDALYP